MTDQRFSIASPPPVKNEAEPKSGPHAAKPEENRYSDGGLQSIEMLSLASANTKLKNDLADTAETVEILKNVIADYLKRSGR